MKTALKRMLHRAMDSYIRTRMQDIDFQRDLLASTTTARFIERHAASAEALQCREDLLRYATQLVRNREGLICEFGVYRGASVNLLADCLPDRTIYGFDSFEGLPVAWRAGFGAGAFGIEGDVPEVRKNVRLVRGWFDESLEPFLAANPGSMALVHIDCDLYASTRTVLSAIATRIHPGTVIVFDEYFNYPGWQQHEHKAFLEFAHQHGCSYDYVAYNAAHQQVIVVCTRSSQ